MADTPVVMLAAGRSSRTGSAGLPKGLIEVQGKPWILGQLEALKRAGLSRVFVVLGHQKEVYEKVLGTHRNFTERSGVEVHLVHNPDPDRGSFSSLQCGLRAVGLRGAWVLPVDVPCPTRAVWESLEQEALVRSADAALPVHSGRGGHPVLISESFVCRLLDLSPDSKESRLDHQIHALSPHQVARVEVTDERVLANLNTLADFASLAG
ncbi:MAG: NTP transferase domain-containing protein [Oligoflexia bacterium]